MDYVQAYKLTQKNPQIPDLDTTVLENTPPEDVKKIFEDRDTYLDAVKTTHPEAFEEVEAVEETETKVETTGDAGTTETETTETEATETKVNPFTAWGINDETYNKYVESGIIKDGKMRGKYTPEQLSEYISQSENEQTLRGHLSNEVGDLRQTVELKDAEIQTVKDYNKQILKSEHLKGALFEVESKVAKSLKQIHLDFDSPLPGLDEAQDAYFKADITEKTLRDPDIRRKLNRAKIATPRTEDDWDDLKRERIDIYDDIVELRDKVYETEAEKLYLQAAIDKEYKSISKSAYKDAAQVLYNNLIEEGMNVPDTDPNLENLIIDGVNFLNKELAQATLENRQPDGRYFYLHPTTGQPIPRAESLDLYLRLNRKDVLKDIPTWTEKPIQETSSDQEYYRDVYNSLVSNLQSAFSKQGLEITADDPLIAEGVNHLIANKDNPLYWSNGKPKEDALVVYQRMEKPTLISDVFEAARRERFQKEREEAQAKFESDWKQRLAQMNDTTASIASSAAQSAPGQSIPIVPPEIFRSPMKMLKLAKTYGVSPTEFYDQQKGRIEQLPPAVQRNYIS